MFASATSGDKANNARFSTCSVNNISSVLKEVLRQNPNTHYVGAKRNCFILRETSFCGNAMVEDGEECDCGFNDEECRERSDSCCYPRSHVGEVKGCTRTPWAECSPSEGVCCNSSTCKFIPPLDRVCREASECSETQMCDGLRASCPMSKPKSDRTVCQDNTKICDAGTCNKSVCELFDMEECFLSDGSPTEQCVLACRKKHSVDSPCIASYNIKEFRSFYDVSGDRKGVLLRPGSPCNDYRGYCDIFQKCRSVDANGPLSRLKNLFFNSETFRTVADWVQDNWWAVVLIAIALILFMALFIKCCAVHTPSTNPRKPPAHNIYETLRHPATLLRNQT
ncbi:unnamed protein product [Soboliphyme baturini]|uniref:Disintegrin domain-containing protein n=1 Tax=Soboliphyme baturini TaxID=241478 RepID=A0A183IJC5_9BILA|nr:unnamed protein product [Soboliphyme baturini]